MVVCVDVDTVISYTVITTTISVCVGPVVGYVDVDRLGCAARDTVVGCTVIVLGVASQREWVV